MAKSDVEKILDKQESIMNDTRQLQTMKRDLAVSTCPFESGKIIEHNDKRYLIQSINSPAKISETNRWAVAANEVGDYEIGDRIILTEEDFAENS